jgi:PIN domain
MPPWSLLSYDCCVKKTMPAPDFNAIYFDSNELLANGWPSPSVQLANFLYIGRSWGVVSFIPLPVLEETEAHWERTLETQIARLASARKELERLSRPAECNVKTTHASLDKMRVQYYAVREETRRRFRIDTIPYSIQSAEFFFRHATKYVLPFEKDGEGKGFQDAVIVQSVLEHLHSRSGLKAILLTKDGGISSRIRHFQITNYYSRRSMG